MPKTKAVVRQVREYRLGNIPAKGKDPDTIKKPGMSSLALAETPTAFHVTVLPNAPFLVLPRVTSERREYAAIGLLSPPIIPSDAVTIALDTTPVQFALLTSAMHMAWLRTVGGKLKSDYRYSIGLVYNNFPLPSGNDLSKLDPHAQAILDARANYPDASLADLYDPDTMPADLRRAHQANDRAVDRLYRKAAFKSERERMEHLFQLYEKMTDPLLAKPAKKRRRRRAS